MRHFSKTAKIVALLFVLAALIVNHISTWPVTIRFSNMRLNYVYGGLLPVFFASTVLYLGLSRKNLVLKYLITAGGGALFFASVLFALLDGDMFKPGDNPGRITLVSELSTLGDHYRLYMDDSVALFPPFADLYKEWDSHIGVRIVRRIWTDFYNCCDLSLRAGADGAVEVIDKSNGKVIAVVAD